VKQRRPLATPTRPKPSAPTAGAGADGPWGTLPPSVGPGGSSSPPTTPLGEAPSGEAPNAPLAPARVEVTAEDTQAFSFVLSRPSVPAGRVIIEFVNHGQDEHNMHVAEGGEGGEAGALGNTAPNAHPSLTLNLRHGSYTFFCSLPGHEAAGMKATLLVN
jgi:plastocyanin